MPDESRMYYGMAWFVRPSVNIWFSTGVTTCPINFNFIDIIHLVRPILTQLLILVIPKGHFSS